MIAVLVAFFHAFASANPADVIFSPATALNLAWLSAAAYCNATSLATWSCLPCQKVPQFTFILPSWDPVSNTFGYLGFDNKTKVVIVSFRGTVPSEFTNWLANLNGEMINYPGVPAAKVHTGFYLVSQIHIQELREPLALLLDILPHDYRIYFTGHSLGGALATLVAMELVGEKWANRTSLLTFGQPRVGNKVFARAVETTLNETIRVTHATDLVVHVPSTSDLGLRYEHFGIEVWYYLSQLQSTSPQNPGPWVNCTFGESSGCSNSIVPILTISDHLTYMGIAISESCTNCYRSTCATGWWSMCCDYECNPEYRCDTSGCLKTTGSCSNPNNQYGCTPRWYGFSNSSNCYDGLSGGSQLLCNQDCSLDYHCSSPRCLKCTGTCENPNNQDGCKTGWWGFALGTCGDSSSNGKLLCDKECSADFHCSSSGCLKCTGTCKNPNNSEGCKTGWWGFASGETCGDSSSSGKLQCNKECSADFHCSSSGCLKCTGTCKNPNNSEGCKKGWFGGENCSDSSSRGTIFCNEPCSASCKNGCKKCTGACL